MKGRKESVMVWESLTILVSEPHILMRRNGLLNEVKVLELVHDFAENPLIKARRI